MVEMGELYRAIFRVSGFPRTSSSSQSFVQYHRTSTVRQDELDVVKKIFRYIYYKLCHFVQTMVKYSPHPVQTRLKERFT